MRDGSFVKLGQVEVGRLDWRDQQHETQGDGDPSRRSRFDGAVRWASCGCWVRCRQSIMLPAVRARGIFGDAIGKKASSVRVASGSSALGGLWAGDFGGGAVQIPWDAVFSGPGLGCGRDG